MPSDHDLTNASLLLPNGDLLPNGVIVSEPSFRDRVIMKLIAMGEGDLAQNLNPYKEETIAAAIKYGVGPGDTAYQIASDRDEALSDMLFEQSKGEP